MPCSGSREGTTVSCFGTQPGPHSEQRTQIWSQWRHQRLAEPVPMCRMPSPLPGCKMDRVLGEGQVHIHQGDQMASCQLLTQTAGAEMSRYWLCRSRKHCASKLKEITRSHITPKTMQVQFTSANLILEWWYTCKYFCTRPALLISLKLI